MEKEETRKIVREAYGKIAQGKDDNGCTPGCCGTEAKQFAQSIGYTEEELKNIPDEANLSLSCGNPTALAGLKPGEVVLDLGCGAGFDCFLAASRVREQGKVIGVDMTPQMLEKARNNARKKGVKNVEFRLGEIENLPVADNSVDVVISNCVLNLSVDKPRVFREIYRVLKPAGRIAISDMALKKELPPEIRSNISAYVGCVSGAVLIEQYQRMLEQAGFREAKLEIKGSTNCGDSNLKDPIAQAVSEGWGANISLEEYVVSINARGYK